MEQTFGEFRGVLSTGLGWRRFGVELADLWWTEHDGASTDGAFTQMS